MYTHTHTHTHMHIRTHTHTHTHTHCRLVWVLYCVFTTLHLYANYQAVSVVCMETLNGNRLHIIMEDLLNSGQMPQPPWVNKREPLLSSMLPFFTCCHLYLSCVICAGISRHLTVTLGVPFSELRMG